MNALQKALHERALEVAGRYRIVEADLLEILVKLDEKKVFRAYGYTSLFQYALSELKLSESTAYNFINVARKSREIPQLKSEIKSGNLSVSKARKIIPVINKSNSALWLEKAKTLPQKSLEKEVAKVSPRVLTPEKAHYVSENRLYLQVGVSEAFMNKLKQVQDVLSQEKRKAATIEEALDEMAEVFLDKRDPFRKAKRQAKAAELVVRQPASGQGVIPAAIKHAVNLRDERQCTFLNATGERCEQKRWLDLHHIMPRKMGGNHSVDNLQLLCFSHHRGMHANL